MEDMKPAFMKLENPSIGSRKESILTDEMMVAFCESRLDWIENDIKELFEELREFSSAMEKEYQEEIQRQIDVREGSYEFKEMTQPYALGLYEYNEEISLKYKDLRLYLNGAEGYVGWGSSKFQIEVPFVDSWEEGSHSLDVMAMRLNYNAEVDLKGFAEWVALHDWAWANIDVFKSAVRFAEHQESMYSEKITEYKDRLTRNQEERNRMTWKKELAESRVKQSKALDIIEHGYKGKEQKLFRKRDVPIMVSELEVLRITPSLKTVDVRFVGRDFKSYSYDCIWRSGTNFTRTKEWISKGVRISTLPETSVVEDFSEAGSPYDPEHLYYKKPRRRYY